MAITSYNPNLSLVIGFFNTSLEEYKVNKTPTKLTMISQSVSLLYPLSRVLSHCFIEPLASFKHFS